MGVFFMPKKFIENAKKVSFLYPKVQLQKEMADWTIGHTYLHLFKKAREQIYILTMVASIWKNKLLRVHCEEKSIVLLRILLYVLRLFHPFVCHINIKKNVFVFFKKRIKKEEICFILHHC